MYHTRHGTFQQYAPFGSINIRMKILFMLEIIKGSERKKCLLQS